MDSTITIEKVVDEIKLIPEHKLPELYDVIHYFRVGLQQAESGGQVMQFAGCWADMPDEVFESFSREIRARRETAFSGRR